MLGGGDFGGGEDGGGGEDSGGFGVGRVGVAGAGGVLAAVGEAAALEEVRGGGDEPLDFGFGTILTRFGTHFCGEKIFSSRKIYGVSYVDLRKAR